MATLHPAPHTYGAGQQDGGVGRVQAGAWEVSGGLCDWAIWPLPHLWREDSAACFWGLGDIDKYGL